MLESSDLIEGFFSGDDDCWIDSEGTHHDLDRSTRETHRMMANTMFRDQMSDDTDSVKFACRAGWVRVWVEGQICFVQLDFKHASRKAVRSCSEFLRKAVGITKVGIEDSASTTYEEVNIKAAPTRLMQITVKQDLATMFEAEKLDEVYSEPNSYLARMMNDSSFDGHQYWYLAYTWASRTGVMADVEEQLGEPPQEDESDQYDKLDDDLQEEFAEWVLEYLRQNDPAELPSSEFFHPDKKLLPRTTWLVHFTDEPEAIANEGFTHGTYDASKLGLTTYYTKTAKKYGGYNFAFVAGSREADWAAHKGKYGKHCVVFQNSGLKAYHNSDEENQVIFWGPDVDRRHIAVIRKSSETGEYEVRSRTGMKLYGGDFEVAVQWVIAHHRQYSSQLYPPK